MRHFFTVLLLGFSFNASAALVDNGWFTTDTDSGLDWLDLDFTAGDNYADAVVNNAGWRHVTNSEMEDLFHKVFENYFDSSPLGITTGYSDSSDSIVYADHEADVIEWQNLFGGTPIGTDRLYSYGIYKDEDNSFRLTGAFKGLPGDPDLSRIFGLENTGYTDYFAREGDPQLSTFLVRSSEVPVPAAVWLFGSGLGLLGWMRKRS